MAHTAQEFRAAAQFVDKHNEHTGHEMEWSQVEFDRDFNIEREWELTCQTCDRTWHFGTKKGAHEFRREHTDYTDHIIKDPPKERSVNLPSNAVDPNDHRALKSFISELEDYYEEGAPEQTIYSHFGDDTNQIATARHGIEQLKRKGEVYQPVEGFLRTV